MPSYETEVNSSPGYDGQRVKLEGWIEVQPPTTFMGLKDHQ
jgi:hypothetical protein